MPSIPSGRALLDSEKNLRQAGLALDMTYADLGAGTVGHFVFPASSIVGPAGLVYAVDILPDVLQSIDSRSKAENIFNIQTIWGDIQRPKGIKIPAGSLDMVSFVNVAHLFMQSSVPFEEAKRLVRLGGKILVIDWDPDAGSLLVTKSHRIDSETIQERFTQAGFPLISSFKAGPQHWGLLFSRP